MKTEPNLNEPKKADEEKMEQDPTLSPRAQAVYNHLRREAFLGRAMPTRRAIADWLKITSLTSVDIHLKQLASRDLVEILPGQQRGLVLKGTGEVPLLHVDGRHPLRRRLDPEADVIDRMSGAVAKRFRGATCFLQLGHYGMNVPGLTEGSIVALDTKAQQGAVSDGAIVVARINDWIRAGCTAGSTIGSRSSSTWTGTRAPCHSAWTSRTKAWCSKASCWAACR